jgi:hypothetical protein
MTTAAQAHNPQRPLPAGSPQGARPPRPVQPPAAGRQPSRPPSQVIQRVVIPDTHDLKNSRRFVQWRAYRDDPQVSQEGHRLGLCYICRKYDYMVSMEVDHVVPENFLRALLDLRAEDKAMAEHIAEALQLNWKTTSEYDFQSTYNAYSGYRDRYENTDRTSQHTFNGNVYEALTDVQNLKLICRSCNGRRIKANKLLKVDYDALHVEYKKWNKSGKTLIKKHLGRWIKSDYYLNPDPVMPNYGSPPNSPGYSPPGETYL